MYNLRSLQAPAALPSIVQNPKSILSEKNYQYVQDVLNRSNAQAGNLRVTFAKLNNPNSYLRSTSAMLSDPTQVSKLVASERRQKGSRHEGQKPHRPGTAETEGKQKAGRSTLPVGATGSKKSFSTGSGELAELYRILNTKSPVTEKPSEDLTVASEARKKKTKRVKSKTSLKLESTISKLLQNKDSGIKIANQNSDRSSLAATPLNRTVPSKSKRLKKMSSKSGTDVPKKKRSKTGKKKKKSSKGVTDEDLVMFKPAKLNEEYVSELHKITKILKAVTAFDEGTSTNAAPGPSSSFSRIKTVSHYHYENGRESSAKVLAAPSKDNPVNPSLLPRPLSAEELKQLLSSITRVVSLHQLPINGPVQPSEPEIGQSVERTPSSKRLDLSPDKFNTNDQATETRKKKKVKRTRSHSNSVLKMTAATISKVTTKSKVLTVVKKSSGGSKRKLNKGKQKERVSRTKSSSSISSNEKDPVKNAVFLKKYFDESVRLASKSSSDDLLQENTHKPGKTKGKKEKRKKEKILHKNGVKPVSKN